ncbi:MAG: uroporphyrinogen-III C-methyltransferase, partial [Actinomycetes bacterium]
LMGILNLPQITGGLMAAGMDPEMPAAIIERGFSPSQRTTHAPLGSLAAEARRADVQAPAVVVVGEVVRLAGWTSSVATAELLAEVGATDPRPEPAGASSARG